MSKCKMHGCGNSFFIYDEIKYGVAENKIRYVIERALSEDVEGILFLSRSNGNADLEMKVYDRDGTEESMCGNGIRCFVKYAFDNGYIGDHAQILTGDGIKKVELNGNYVAVDMGEPRQYKSINESYHFIYTGVPHIVYFVDVLSRVATYDLGRKLRYDKDLCSSLGYADGISVNFVKVLSKNNIAIMTYEVGVESVTKACGTGSAAAAFVSHISENCIFPVKVSNMGGEILIDYREKHLIMIGSAEYM